MAKKKIWWVLGTLAMVLVVVATSVSLTIAALQAQIKTGFSISYTAKNVNAVVAGIYEYGANFTYKDDYYTGGEEQQLFAPVKTALFIAGGKDFVDLSKTAEVQLEQAKIAFSSDIYGSQLIEAARWELQTSLDWSGADVSNITSWGSLEIRINFFIINFSANELPVKLNFDDLQMKDNVKTNFTSPDGQFETTTQFVVDGIEEELSIEETIALAKQAIESGQFANIGADSMEKVKAMIKMAFHVDDCSDDLACLLVAGAFGVGGLNIGGTVNCNFELLNNTVSTDISGNVNFTFGL